MQVSTVFSPALFEYSNIKEDFVCVVVDILRATTTMCTIIEWGGEIIPVASLEVAKEYKDKGFLVAGERIERKIDFADYGNSALNFRNKRIKGKTIVHTTTNGTQAIKLAQTSSAKEIVIGAFANIDALADYLKGVDKNVIVLCSGWKNTFCLEDTLFAGALMQRLLEGNTSFSCKDDATFAAIDLWNTAKGDLRNYLEKAAHIHRLRKAQMDDVFEYTFTLNTCHSVPILRGDRLVRL